MKTFLSFDPMPLHCDSGSRHDFPRLAREAGFSFNLYRGRVDWAKIGAVDVDKIVRERDLETLQDVLSCVMSCNLSNDYDLKILDPNFLKIFQLAQLATDFLLYCRTYLDHCVTVMQDQLRIALQEIEHLRKIQQESADEISSLQKKLRTKSVRSRNTSPHPIFKCPVCAKIFVGEQYLLAHQQRRHPELIVETTTSNNNNSKKEVENLQFQVHELQERLRATEDALKQKQNSPIPDVAALQAILQNEIQKLKPAHLQEASTVLDMVPQDNLLPQNGTTPEIPSKAAALVEPSLVDTFHNEPTTITETYQQLKDKYENSQKLLLVRVDQQNEEIKALREQLHEQHLAHEQVMQKKLQELQSQHRADLDDLRLSILKDRGAGDHFVSSLTSNTEKVESEMHHFPINTVQAWNKSSEMSSGNKTPTLQITSKVFEPDKSSVNHSINKNSWREEIVPKEELIPTLDQVSPVPSSQTSFDEKIISPHKRGDLPEPLKGAIVDTSHRNTMYDRSSSSSSGKSSQASSSSYDSDSQSSNSEQNSAGNDTDHDQSKLQLAPQILDGLKEDLFGLLNRRLRELGVDPDWKGLPAASFHSNMATVKHHQNIAAKSNKSYFEIQEAILKEVDKQISDRLKLQQSTSNSSNITKKKLSRSFSIFARIKSNIKNKLSHSGHSTEDSESNQNVATKARPVENTYSNEPSTSYSGHMNEYEVLQEKKTSPDTKDQRKDQISQDEVEKEPELLRGSVMSQHSMPSTSSSNMTYGNSESKPLAVSGIKSSVKVYSRSMYANLNKSEIEAEKKESSSSDSSVHKPSNLQTSTPIKSSSDLLHIGSKKPMFMSSDVESISELESELNEVMENTSVKAVPISSRPHTSLTTQELLANVAKFRQTSQINSTQSIVKSNLKSSLSTGNIKKKVVFRDEKDGFDTIELGPAHSSYESLPPQRSLSENSLAITSSSPLNSEHPVPQPRTSLAPDTAFPTASNRADTDSDGDWDWDKDLSDTLTLKEKSTRESVGGNEGNTAYGFSQESVRSNSTLEERRWSTGSAESGKVSDIVKDLERKLQEKREKPLFGINISAPHSSVISAPTRFSRVSYSNSDSNTSAQQAVALGSHHLSDRKLSGLLLDDVSSS